MKIFLIILFILFTGATRAETVNIDWLANDTTYTASTCELGGDLIIPATNPTKYGYTFRGWQYNEIYGTGVQTGTPTPTDPIEPVFKPFGNTVLRAIGGYADSYDPVTGKITRRIGVKVLNGTELWSTTGTNYYTYVSALDGSTSKIGLSNYFQCTNTNSGATGKFVFGGTPNNGNILFAVTKTWPSVSDWNAFLAERYAADQPVTIYYKLATPVEESFVQ